MNLAKNQISRRDGLKLGLAGLTVSPWGAPFFAKAATEEKMTIAIMKEMVKSVPDAGSCAPVTVLIDERLDGVHLSYYKMESHLLPYGNSDALAVARNLDAKITTLLRECTSCGRS
jgi:hypothetical protein